MLLSRALVAIMFASLALAGCLGDDPPEEAEPTALPTPEPTPIPDPWPECALVPGKMAWPSLSPVETPEEPVMATIKYDAYGVPHIYADDLYSLFYANGYAQAKDRLFQMDILRQVGYGESAMHLGTGQLGLDVDVHRSLYTREEMAEMYAQVPPEGKQAIEAYAAGVNRFMAEAIARDALPVEFPAIGRVPPTWTPLDTVAVVIYLIGFFGVDGGYELGNLARLDQLQATLGEEAGWDALGDWVWLRTDDTYTAISPDDLVLNGCEEPLPFEQVTGLPAAGAAKDAIAFGVPGDGQLGIARFPSPIGPLLSQTPGPGYRLADHGIMNGFKWGSNALVVNANLTDTGKPMMWGAPQMGYYKPPVPWQVGLHGAGYDAVGIGVSGAPGMVIGRNADIAWTATSGFEDLVDLVTLELDGPRGYVWDGKTKEMDCWTVEHQTFTTPDNLTALLAGQAPRLPMTFDQEVCRAEGWPVVYINQDAGYAWLAKTSTRGEELVGAFIWLTAPLQDSVDGFREHVADFPFTFNFLVVDEDDAMLVHTGDLPLRAPGYDVRLPAPSGSKYDWQGEALTGELGTWIKNPSRGYVANWNNAPVHGWRAGDVPTLWGPTHRVDMIELWMQDKLADDDGFSLEDMRDVNWLAATHDSYALAFLPYLIAAAAGDEALLPLGDALASWGAERVPWRDDDGDGFYDDPGHAIWDAVIQPLFDRIVGDEMGELTPDVELEPASSANNSDHGTANNGYAALLAMLQAKTAHDWCDDVSTEPKETCLGQIQAALRDAKGELAQGGPSPDDWMVPVHTSKFFAFGAFAADERPMVNRGSWVQTVSMAESERSGGVMPPANAGLITPLEFVIASAGGAEPARLTAELDLYWSGDYKALPLTSAEVDAVAVSTFELLVVPT